MYPIPANATRIRYLESTGTQYIDTGVVAGPNTRSETDIAVTWGGNDHYELSGCGASRHVFGRGWTSVAHNAHLYIGLGDTNYDTGVLLSSLAGRHTYWIDATLGNGGYDDTEFSISATVTENSFTSLLLAQRQTATIIRGPMNAKLYGCRYYQSGAIVRSFVPVRIGSVGCLFDRVTGQFFYNHGTGSFVCGEDDFSIFSHAVKHLSGTGAVLASRAMGDSFGTVKVVRKHYDMPMQYTIDECNGNTPTTVNVNFPSDKYTALDYTPVLAHHRFAGWFTDEAVPYDAEVEYIESTGTQYFDTGIVYSAPMEFYAEVANTAAWTTNNTVYGSSCVYPRLNTGWGSANKIDLGMGAGVASPTHSQSIALGEKFTLLVRHTTSNRQVWLNGESLWSGVNQPAPTSTSIWLFGSRRGPADSENYLGYAFIGRMYAFKIFQGSNYELVRDYVPVRIGNRGFMYERVNGVLYGNLGTGSFAHGSDMHTYSVKSTDSVVYDIQNVYGGWQEPVSITFDATTGGGQMPSDWVSPEYYGGQPFGTLPAPAKTGEVFLGWWLNSNRVTTSSIVPPQGVTLVARYAVVTYDTSFQVTTTSSYRKTGIYSATSRNSSNPTVVDWGDGTTDVVYGNISQLTHTYSSNGTFTVQVNDNISNIALSTNASAWYETTSQNRYTVKKLTSLGANITVLPSAAFMYCSAMTDALLPSNASFKTIPQNCFAYCTTLKPVTIPSTVTTITDRAFQYITGSQFTSVTIPAAVTSIGSYAFYNCNYLKNITLESGSATLALNTYSFAYCFYQSTAVGTVDLSPRKITSIPNYCFYYCRYLKGITWPQGLTSIGGYAFRYCFYYSASTGTVEIPEGVTSFSGTYAFANCLYLTAVTLPSTLTNLNNYTFYYCTRLATITSNRSTAPTVSAATFGNGTTYYTGRTSYSAGTNRLYVPAGATGYNASYWSSVLLDSTKCGFTLEEMP